MKAPRLLALGILSACVAVPAFGEDVIKTTQLGPRGGVQLRTSGDQTSATATAGVGMTVSTASRLRLDDDSVATGLFDGNVQVQGELGSRVFDKAHLEGGYSQEIRLAAGVGTRSQRNRGDAYGMIGADTWIDVTSLGTAGHLRGTIEGGLMNRMFSGGATTLGLVVGAQAGSLGGSDYNALVGGLRMRALGNENLNVLTDVMCALHGPRNCSGRAVLEQRVLDTLGVYVDGRLQFASGLESKNTTPETPLAESGKAVVGRLGLGVMGAF